MCIRCVATEMSAEQRLWQFWISSIVEIIWVKFILASRCVQKHTWDCQPPGFFALMKLILSCALSPGGVLIFETHFTSTVLSGSKLIRKFAINKHRNRPSRMSAKFLAVIQNNNWDQVHKRERWWKYKLHYHYATILQNSSFWKNCSTEQHVVGSRKMYILNIKFQHCMHIIYKVPVRICYTFLVNVTALTHYII